VALPEDAVNAINDVSGAHEGHRAAHAKGTLLSGSFSATPEGSRLTRAAHMRGDPVRATVRLSNGGGNPNIPDYAREGRGMAVKLYLPGGEKTDLVALSVPCFFARTPEDFIEFTRLRKPDPETGQPDMEKLGAWLGEHPEAGPAIEAAVSAPPPASYAQVAYNGIHSFRWIDADGESRWIRFSWLPEAGEAGLGDDEARERGRDYLQEEILERLPVAFRLVVKIAAEGDPIDDPTATWPDERETVDAGRLKLTGPETERERGGDILVFDPSRLVDGVEMSDDPILRFRPKAYSVSIERRSGAPPPSARRKQPARPDARG
jgi:catalase